MTSFDDWYSLSFHERAQAQTFIQLARQNQTTVGDHSRALSSTRKELLNES